MSRAAPKNVGLENEEKISDNGATATIIMTLASTVVTAAAAKIKIKNTIAAAPKRANNSSNSNDNNNNTFSAPIRAPTLFSPGPGPALAR